MHSCRDRDISANFLSYGGDVLAEFDPFETFYAVVIPLSGKVASLASQRVCVAPGRAPLRLESPTDGGDYAMSWYRLLRFMIDELDRSGSLLETAAKARVFEHHLVTLLLEIQSHNYAHALDLTNLREVRVRRGRGGLCSVPRDEVTVDGLARRWSVTHHGRLFALYRERFGRVLSETLRR